MDPFSLIAAGVGTLGSLAGGIYDAATMPARKRQYLRDQQRALADNYLMDKMSRVMPRTAAEYGPQLNLQNVQRQADQQFKVNPMSFVPFVQNASNLAGQIYQGAQSPQAQRAPVDSVLRAQQAASDQRDALERAEAMKFFQANGWEPYGRSY